MLALKQLIDKNNIISFDIFDTLILRNIYQPTDIFRILAKFAKDEFDIDDDMTPLDQKFFDWLVIKASDYTENEFNLFMEELNIPDYFMDLFINDKETGMTEDEYEDLQYFIKDAFDTTQELNGCFERDYGSYEDGYEY